MSGFDPKAYVQANAELLKQPAFDPAAYVKQNADLIEAKKPKTSTGESFMRATAQGASAGFIDEGTALIGAAKDALTSNVDFGTAYKGWKSALGRADAQAREDHPVVSTVGEIAGGIGTAVALPAALAGKAGLLAKVANPALAATKGGRIGAAATLGAISGAGHSKGSLVGDNAEKTELALDTARGGALGGATQYAFEKVGPLVKWATEKLPKNLRGGAERRAFKAAVGNQQKAYDEAAAKGVINERGRDLLDEGVVTFGSSAKTIAERSKDKAKQVGKEIGDLLEKVDASGSAEQSFNGRAAADKLRAYAGEIGGTGNKSLVKQLLEAADDLETQGVQSLKKAQVEKNSWEYSPGALTSVPKKVANRVKQIISEEMETAVGRMTAAGGKSATAAEQSVIKTGTGPSLSVGNQADEIAEAVAKQSGGEISKEEASVLASSIRKELAQANPAKEAPSANLRGEYENLKSRYGTFASAAKDAGKLASREEKNRTASLSDYLTALAGMGSLGFWKGAALGAANNVVRKRGSSAAAVTMDKIGAALEKSPALAATIMPLLNAAANQGVPALITEHARLMNENDEYRRAVQAVDQKSAIDRRIGGK